MEVVDRLLQLTKTGVEAAVLAQIKLVWIYSSLKSIQYMDVFIKSHCRALEIPAVLDQAVLLHEKWTAAAASAPMLPDSQVKDPNCHAELTYAHFPDLYYASITYPKVHKLIGENFLMSVSHVSTQVALIDKYIRKMATAELGELSEEAKAKLTKLGYPVTRRRRRETDTDEEESGTS